MTEVEQATRQEKRYDVDRAAFLLRWVALYATRPDADIQPALEAVKGFLDAICPTCGGRGDYIDARGDKEPCDDCGMWTGQTVITYVGGVNTELLEELEWVAGLIKHGDLVLAPGVHADIDSPARVVAKATGGQS